MLCCVCRAQRLAKKSSANEDGKDGDEFEEEPLEFLSLDDVVEDNMGDNLNLEEDWDDDATENGNSRSTLTTQQQRAALRFAFTLGNTSSLPSQATSMDMPSLDNPRINGSDFRMNSCFLSPTGALMLGTSMDLISSNFAQLLAHKTGDTASFDDETTKNEKILEPGFPGVASSSESNIQQTENMNAFSAMDYDNHSDHDGGVADWAMENNFDYTGDDGFASAVLSGVIDSTVQAEQQLLGNKPMQRDLEYQSQLKNLIDPWAMHEPHSVDSAPARPFAKGKPFKIPKKTKLWQSKPEEQTKANTFLTSFVAGVALSDLDMGLSKPFLPEFEYVFEESKKRKRLYSMQKRKEALISDAARIGVVVDDQQLKSLNMDDQEEDERDELVLAFGLGTEASKNKEPNSAANLWATDFGADTNDDDYDRQDYGNQFDGGDIMETDVWAQGEDHFAPSRMDDDNGAEVTYEEHCRRRLEEYFRSAQQYVHETELSARIDEWGSKLAPLLQDQESRPVFDIHVYGTRLIQGFNVENDDALARSLSPVQASLRDLLLSSPNPHLEEYQESQESARETQESSNTNVSSRFSSSSRSQLPSFEVSRAFSSMLQLANMGNVKIIPKRNNEGLHEITLQLLSTVPGVDIDSIAQNQVSSSQASSQSASSSTKSKIGRSKGSQK